MSKKNKGSPKTADIYLSAPLLCSFLVDLDFSSVLKLFICPNMNFYPYLDSLPVLLLLRA